MQLENFFKAHFQQSQEETARAVKISQNQGVTSQKKKKKCSTPKSLSRIWWLFSVESDGEGPRLKFEQEDGQTDGETKWHVRAFDTSVVPPSQSCKVKLSIWNVHDQPRITSYATVVNRLRPVEFKTIPQPRILHACHQWRNTDCVFVTRDFRPSVWPCSWSNFGLGLSPSNSSKKVYKIRDYGLECSFS